jgi:hypothetical protein
MDVRLQYYWRLLLIMQCFSCPNNIAIQNQSADENIDELEEQRLDDDLAALHTVSIESITVNNNLCSYTPKCIAKASDMHTRHLMKYEVVYYRSMMMVYVRLRYTPRMELMCM